MTDLEVRVKKLRSENHTIKSICNIVGANKQIVSKILHNKYTRTSKARNYYMDFGDRTPRQRVLVPVRCPFCGGKIYIVPCLSCVPCK